MFTRSLKSTVGLADWLGKYTVSSLGRELVTRTEVTGIPLGLMHLVSVKKGKAWEMFLNCRGKGIALIDVRFLRFRRPLYLCAMLILFSSTWDDQSDGSDGLLSHQQRARLEDSGVFAHPTTSDVGEFRGLVRLWEYCPLWRRMYVLPCLIETDCRKH